MLLVSGINVGTSTVCEAACLFLGTDHFGRFRTVEELDS